MIHFKQIPIATQVLSAFGALCLVLTIIGGLFLFSLGAIEHRRQTQQARAHQKWEVVDEVAKNVGLMQAEVLQHVFTTDAREMEQRDQSIRALDAASVSILTEFNTLVDNEKERRLYASILKARNVYLERTDALLVLSRVNRNAEAAEVALEKQSPVYLEYQGAAYELIEEAEENARQSRIDTSRLIGRLGKDGGILIGVAMIITLGTGITVMRVTRRLRADNETLQTEITGRQRAQELLRQSKAELHHLVSANPSVIYSLKFENGELVPTWISDNIAQLTGHVPGEVLAPNWWADRLHPDDRERVQAEHAAPFPGDRLLTEYRFQRKDWSYFWVRDEKTLLRDAAGLPVEVVGSWADITASKRAIQELDHIFSLSRDLLCIGGFDGSFKRLNPAWHPLLGWTNEELMARPFMSFVHPDDAGKTAAEVRKLAEGGETIAFEIRILCKDDSYRWVLWNANPTRGEPQFYAAGRDITERKLLETQRERLAALLEASPDFIGFADAKTSRIQYINKHGRGMCGIGEGEDLGKLRISDLHPAWMNKRLAEVILPAAVRDGLWEGEGAFLHRDGSEIPVLMALLARKGANGEVDIFHTVSRNITERKRVEDALRESESRFRSLSAASPLGIFQTDATGRCTYTNERWREISGQSLEESLGFGWNQVLHPEDRERVLREWQECASQRQEVFVEYRILGARKETRWISARVKPMLAADGAITGWVGTVEDITERKRSEEDRMKFFALVENSSEYISMADREGKVFYLNPAGRRMAGIAEDADLASINWRRLYDDKNWKHRCEVAIPTLTATGRWDGEIRMRNLQTEQLLDLRVQGFRVLDPRSGKALCMATVQRDITASKRAEEDREKFVALLENSGDFIGMASLEGKPFYLNRAGRDLVGLGREIDVSTTTICEYYNDETAALVQNTGIPATFATGGWAAEANLRHFATHALIPVHMHTILVKDSKTGQPICLATVARDITDMKEAEKKLEKAHRGLRDMSRLSGMAEIATNVLHNVGNVLNSVNVSADQILEKVNRLRPVSLEKVAALLREHAHDLPDFLARDPQGKALPGYLSALFDQLADPHKDILPEVASLRKNVEHIREIVRMQQNCASVTGVLETIALTDLVEDAIRLDAASLTRHGVRVIREFSPVPSFPIEKHKVLQILVNLLKNAKQALDAAGGPDAQLTLRVGMNGGGTVKVSVIDNGVGIEPENLTRIFEHGFTTRKGGHGFGLHSGALAAQEMGGSLTAHSDGPGKGAELVLELPCGPAEKNL